jgi:hypothetical protein
LPLLVSRRLTLRLSALKLGLGANDAERFLLSVPRSCHDPPRRFVVAILIWLGGKQRLSWAPQAMTVSGNWASNGLRFATKEEAEMYVALLSLARNTRVVESFEPLNYRWDNRRLVRQE